MLFDWQQSIRQQRGELGTFSYQITSSSGIGYQIKVVSNLTGDELDLTDTGTGKKTWINKQNQSPWQKNSFLESYATL